MGDVADKGQFGLFSGAALMAMLNLYDKTTGGSENGNRLREDIAKDMEEYDGPYLVQWERNGGVMVARALCGTAPQDVHADGVTHD